MVRQKNQIHHGIIFNFLLFFHFSSAQIGTVPNSTADSTDSYPLGPKINKNTTIVMVVLVCVFVALGFLSFLTRRCSEDRGLNRTTQRARSWRTTRGLDATVIAAFPTFVYSSIKGLKFGKGSLECAICLNEFEDDETLRLIPHCSHVFHTGCIDAWLNLHSTCPVCRASLVPSSGDISFAELLISEGNRDIESGNRDNTNPAPASDSTEVNIVNPVQLGSNQNHPPRSRSAGWRLSSIFQRSYSTGHDVVALRSGQNYERFTLRLPAEVQSQLVSASLNRARSCVVLPRVQSSRQGYRSRSGGISGRGRLTSRSGRSGRWNFSLTAPFDRRNGSRRDQGVAEGEGVGERSFERLRPDGDDQV